MNYYLQMLEILMTLFIHGDLEKLGVTQKAEYSAGQNTFC